VSLLQIDEFVLASKDARLAWIGVAIALRLTSIRGLTIATIAQQLGVTAASVRYAAAEIARMANLDDDGGVQSIRPGSKSNGAKPNPVQAQIASMED
jgi:hypothetical protein